MKKLPPKITGFRSSVINQIIDCIRDRTVTAGTGLRTSETPSGLSVSVIPSEQGNSPVSAVLCEVVSGDTLNGYKVRTYPDGFGSTPSSDLYDLFPTELALGSSLPPGSLIIGFKGSTLSTDGMEES